MPKSRNRVELESSRRHKWANGKDVGPVDPNEQIEVSVYLRRSQSLPNAEEIGTTPIASRKYLSREEFARGHAAESEDLSKIQEFADEYGLRVAGEDPARRLVKLSGTVQNFNHAFGTDLRRYEYSSGIYRCRTGTV